MFAANLKSLSRSRFNANRWRRNHFVDLAGDAKITIVLRPREDQPKNQPLLGAVLPLRHSRQEVQLMQIHHRHRVAGKYDDRVP